MTVFKNRKARFVARKINIPRLPFRVFRCAESFDIRMQFPAHFVQNFPRDGRINPDDQMPVCRNEIHQTRKFKFDRLEIAVNVGVVEFDIVDDGDFGQIVHKLRLFIKISRVVFVAFDNEKIAVGHAKRRAEILHDAADQK